SPSRVVSRQTCARFKGLPCPLDLSTLREGHRSSHVARTTDTLVTTSHSTLPAATARHSNEMASSRVLCCMRSLIVPGSPSPFDLSQRSGQKRNTAYCSSSF